MNDAEKVMIECAAVEVARKLCTLNPATLERVIAWREDARGILADAAPAVELVSIKSTATLKILVFAINELRIALPTSAEIAAGSAEMLNVMQQAMGGAPQK